MEHEYYNVNVRLDVTDPRQKAALDHWRECLATHKIYKAAGIFALWSEAAKEGKLTKDE